MIKVDTNIEPRISQGDIYKDVEYVEYVNIVDDIIDISKIIFPYVIVLTQDCDLRQDFKFRWEEPKPDKHDKLLISVLVAPFYNAEHVFQGKHLSELNLTMEPINKAKTPGLTLMRNQNPRYHYLEFPSDIQIVSSVIDFKHYFSVNIEYLKDIQAKNFVCRASTLFRESISQRFAYFLSRIGLPGVE